LSYVGGEDNSARNQRIAGAAVTAIRHELLKAMGVQRKALHQGIHLGFDPCQHLLISNIVKHFGD
jgi:hypothetical protein